jgi:hypothetical protein
MRREAINFVGGRRLARRFFIKEAWNSRSSGSEFDGDLVVGRFFTCKRYIGILFFGPQA